MKYCHICHKWDCMCMGNEPKKEWFRVIDFKKIDELEDRLKAMETYIHRQIRTDSEVVNGHGGRIKKLELGLNWLEINERFNYQGDLLEKYDNRLKALEARDKEVKYVLERHMQHMDELEERIDDCDSSSEEFSKILEFCIENDIKIKRYSYTYRMDEVSGGYYFNCLQLEKNGHTHGWPEYIDENFVSAMRSILRELEEAKQQNSWLWQQWNRGEKLEKSR